LIWLKDWSWELGYEAAVLPRGAALLGRKKAKTDGVVATKALTRKLARACYPGLPSMRARANTGQ